MIKYQSSSDYISFVFYKEGKPVDFQQWASDEESCVYSDLLQEFIDNGSAIAEECSCKVSWDSI